MKKIIATIMVLVLTSSILAGCGNSSAKTGENDTNQSSKQEVAGGITYPYTYTDAAGRQVKIEKQPVKVAVDYLPLWETLMMLDVMPIAATGAENYRKTWDAFQGYDVSSVKELGDKEVNLELLAELQPDIVLHQSYDPNNLDIDNLTKVSNVAVFANATKMNWRLSLREVAKVVNKEAKAEEVISDIDQKLAQDRKKLNEKYAGETVIQVSVMGQDKYYCAYRPDLYDQNTGLGLKLPEGYPKAETYTQVSLESMVQMNPDHIFLNVFDGDDAIYDSLKNNPVWQSLKAVKAGHVYVLDGSGHAASPLATLYTVNFMTEKLLGK